MKYIAGFEYTDDEWDTMDKTARRKVSEVILDLLLSPTYRIPMPVTEIQSVLLSSLPTVQDHNGACVSTLL